VTIHSRYQGISRGYALTHIRHATFKGSACAKNDLRLTWGYEVSAWATVPNANMEASDLGDNDDVLKRKSSQREYVSSERSYRNFRGNCGATVAFPSKRKEATGNVAVEIMR